jgi:hypothetical protein
MGFSMENANSFDAHDGSESQGIPRFLRNLAVNYGVHTNTALVLVVMEINSAHILLPYLRFILTLSSHLCLGLPNCLFPLD